MRRASATPAVAGAMSAVVALLTNVAIVAIPVVAAHAFNARTDASTLDAVMVALGMIVLGHRGALISSGNGIDGLITLAPLGLLTVFALVCLFAARRLGRSLNVTESTGALREGAFATLGLALATFSVTYGVLATALGILGASAAIHPAGLSVAVSTTALAAFSGAVGLALSLTRPKNGIVPRVGPLDLVARPYSSVFAASGTTILAMLGGAGLVTGVQIVRRGGEIGSLYAGLDADWFGNLTLTLAQLTFVPTLIVWALALMLGGLVAFGPGTGLSYSGALIGALPALPILGALPEPGVFSPWLKLLLLVPLAAVVLGCWVLARETRDQAPRERVIAWAGYAVVTIVGILLLAHWSTGQIGSNQLSQVGPVVPSLVVPLLLIVAVPTAIVALAVELGARERALTNIAALRERAAAKKAARESAKETPDFDESAEQSSTTDDELEAKPARD